MVNRSTLNSYGCDFCRISRGESTKWIDQPLFESDNFVAIPTLGSMIPGWTMIVPKAHALNAVNLYSTPEFKSISREVISRIKQSGSLVHMFEHGALNTGSLTGCGVDHAHVHFAPLKHDLGPSIRKVNPGLKWTEFDLNEIDGALLNSEYLLIGNNIERGFASVNVAFPDYPTSQFFRKAIAIQLGIDRKYDYKQFNFKENILKTYRFFQLDDQTQVFDVSLA